jgi:hypothetical protein
MRFPGSGLHRLKGRLNNHWGCAFPATGELHFDSKRAMLTLLTIKTIIRRRLARYT